MSEMKGNWVDITAADDHVYKAYHVLAGGDRGRRGGLVVIQEIFGVNNHIRDVCDRLARAGFTARSKTRTRSSYGSAFSPRIWTSTTVCARPTPSTTTSGGRS